MEQRKELLRKMNICRFCLSNDENELTNIYQKEPKTVPLPVQIMSCASIEVFANDGLPQLICFNCKQQTNQAYIFKSNCRKADDALKNFLRTGELVRPSGIQKPHPQNAQKRPLTQVTPVKDVKIVTKKSASNDSSDVKRMKLNDGTEIITLCISQSDDACPSQDEVSQDSVQASIEPSYSESQEESEDEICHDEQLFKHPEKAKQCETDIYACEYCDKAFPLEQLLELHVAGHDRERQFACGICDTKFFTKYDMMKHEQTHNDEKRFSCSICSKEFARIALLRRHEAIHTDVPNYVCTECDKRFLVKEDLETHMKKHEKNRPFFCSLCKKSFVFKQGLERHMNSAHAEDKPYKCNYCKASFNTPIRLTRHITSHAGLRPYPCKICGRTFLLSHHLTRHMRSHYGKEPAEAVGQHKCDICSMSFRRKDSLINHSAIHSMVNLRCVICNTSFETAKMVKDHITSHLQGLPFPCEKCDYSFDTEQQLMEHEVKHAEMEYEEQIEQEVISEVAGCRMKQVSPEDQKMACAPHGKHEEDDMESDEMITNFHIADMDDPSTVVPSTEQSSSSAFMETATGAQLSEQSNEEPQEADRMSQFFKTEAATTEDEDEDGIQTNGENENVAGDSTIKPIYRIEGTKMYQRKGPIQRKIPEVQSDNLPTAPLEEINEPLNMRAIAPDALSNMPTKRPVNVKVGDKVVKVQKFIISKEEMKNMAKLGILELKNGQVIMKTPGKQILNATIKPVQQSDIENLLNNQRTNSRTQVKQYERKTSVSHNVPSGSSTVDDIIADFV